MNVRYLAYALLLVAATASANGSPPTPPPSTPSTSLPESKGSMATPRQEAEQSYAGAYEEIGKAKQDLAKGKTKNAEKRFRKALERAERATEFDSTYHEAWNLIGYAARNLGDYERSLSAYEHSLRLKFDYPEAREYLGETHLAMGNLKGAREQLGLLERLRATDEHAKLKTAIDAYVAAHPEATSEDGEGTKPAEGAASETGQTKP